MVCLDYDAFAGVADAREDLLFGAITDKAVAAKLGLKTPAVKVNRKGKYKVFVAVY